MTGRALRILSIVTLVSPLGEYGGPTRVAANQAAALRERGHVVTLLAGMRGYDDPPTDIEGTPALLFPVRQLVPRSGHAGLSSPGLLRWLRQHVHDYDVVHVHVARDLVTLPAAWVARRAGVPYVLQPHGMIDPSTHPLATPLDRFMTVPVLRDARRVMYLTETERRHLTEVAGRPVRTVPLLNGVVVPDEGAFSEAPRVLYLARLAPRKRPRMFVDMAEQLAARHPTARFDIVGPDAGEGRAVQAMAERARRNGARVEWLGAVAPERTQAEMHDSSIFVLPSVDEPNGMSVLEAMSAGLPVVITDTCGLARDVRSAGAGIVVDASLDALVGAVDQLLADPQMAREMGEHGRKHVTDHLGMGEIARQLEEIYGS